MQNSELFLKRFTENGNKITKILSWSLFAVPKNAISSNTLVLLPDLYYSSHHPSKSKNVKLFNDNEKVINSLIFLNNNNYSICVIAEYAPDENGEFKVINVVDNKDSRYTEALKYFNQIWNKSVDY